MKYKVVPKKEEKNYSWRLYFVIFVITLGMFALVARMIYLGVFQRTFLEKQSAVRSIRVVDIPAHRGMILDRNGVPLAMSTEVDSFWINPEVFKATLEQKHELVKLIKIPLRALVKKEHEKRGFVYLKRHMPPAVGNQIKTLKIPGLFIKKEYKRYYPQGEVSAQLIGFTNVDDKGQEGLELAYNNYLSGKSGAKQVLKDRLGHVISDIKTIKEPEPGQNLTLSIDNNIQYLAYSKLKATVNKFNADSGVALVLDVKTGEVLAMANMPSYNPNKRPAHLTSAIRNRAITDLFEPGSTIKTFSIVNALLSGKYTPQSTVDTNPGWYYVEGKKIIDEHMNYGVIDLAQILQKSSNIGISKITLSLPPDSLLDTLQKFGFGQSTGCGFPGEAGGTLPDNLARRPFVLATLSFGYGISATPLQLARAYASIADGGYLKPINLLKVDSAPKGQQIIPTPIANETLQMLESVLKAGGTGTRGNVPGYNIAGKTGTAYIADKNGYNKHKYIAAFIGIAPIKDPRLVVAVIVKNPKRQHYGGLVAAPLFSNIMEGALRILNIPPDNLKAIKN